MSKGCNRRPTKVDDETFAKNWEKIFGKGSAGDFARAIEAEAEHSPPGSPSQGSTTPAVEGD